jgi:hypothetical protein
MPMPDPSSSPKPFSLSVDGWSIVLASIVALVVLSGLPAVPW